jgi:succinate dehydrogenase / fumarate reductase cytochrome b subunit
MMRDSKRQRPVNLELSTIKLPVMGLASILHRISAVIVWFSLAWFLPLLYSAMSSAEGFANTQTLLQSNFIAQFLTWGFLTAFGYYAMGGLKHMIQELGYFEELESGRLISQTAIGLGLVLSAVFAYLVWG